MIDLETIEEIRSLSSDELSKACLIKREEARTLKLAVNPKHYSTIVDSSLSLEEMAKKTKLSQSTVSRYRNALINVGLETRKERHVRKGSKEKNQILKLVEGNPSTYREIIEVTGSTKELTSYYVRQLKKGDNVRTVKMNLGTGKGACPFHSKSLIGDLSGQNIVYCTGEEELLGKKIIEYLPNNLTRQVRKSLSGKLGRLLPKESFDVVHEYLLDNKI